MQLKFLFVAVLLTFGFAQAGLSQTASNEKNDEIVSFEISKDFSFFGDEENNVVFVDFENLSVNLSEIVVLNKETGNVVLREDVADLPVNTIFEIDLAKFKKGNYEVELRSYTGVMKKSLTVK